MGTVFASCIICQISSTRAHKEIWVINKGQTENAVENQLKHLKSTTGVQTVMAERLKTLLHFLSPECHARGSQGDTTSLPPDWPQLARWA